MVSKLILVVVFKERATFNTATELSIEPRLAALIFFMNYGISTRIAEQTKSLNWRLPSIRALSFFGI